LRLLHEEGRVKGEFMPKMGSPSVWYISNY